MEKKFIEVCSGCGGMSLGFLEAGYQPVLLNDNNKTCCETLTINHPDVKIECKDMKKLDLTNSSPFNGLLIGGVPCQSFSLSGKRKGLDDKRGNLIIYFKTLLDQLQPTAFIIENVKGLKIHDKGKTLDKVIENLNSNGNYNIQYKLLNANDYEVPQKRERLFIVGIHKRCGLKTFEYPTPLVSKPTLKDAFDNIDSTHEDHIGYQYSSEKVAVFSRVPPGGCWVDLPVDIQKEYMGKNYYQTGGRRGIAKRLSMDAPSPTLTTNPCQNHAERCHPIELRPLTILEYRRIQTFPDDFKLYGAMSTRYKQIGNAVPVKLAYHIAKSFDKFCETI